jgi:putative polyketide hydroxylase
MRERIESVPVVVVGAGPAGLTAAITLAREGIETLVIDRRRRASTVPRATSVSTWTMELMRAWGLEAHVREGDSRVDMRPLTSSTLAAASSGQVLDAGFPTAQQAALVSPTAPACVPQDHLEPVLEEHLRSLGPARLERGAELLGLENGTSGVTLSVRDAATGGRRRIRSRFVIGADGTRSSVRSAAGIGTTGEDGLGERVALLFRAPLWDLVGEHRHVIYLITGADRGSFFVPAGRSDRWIFGSEWYPDRERLVEITPRRLIEELRAAAGVVDLEPRIERLNAVSYATAVADRFRERSVFLTGDAAHQVTPRGGTGMNTAIRSAHDLAWKLSWVLRGWGGESLLDSYEAERRPVAEYNVARSSDASGTVHGVDESLRADIGGRIAHVWVRDRHTRVSTLDLLGPGLTLFTGPDGAAWDAAAGSASRRPPIAVRRLDELTAHGLGIRPAGALLARPDGVPIALWPNAEHAPGELTTALAPVTGRRAVRMGGAARPAAAMRGRYLGAGSG